MAQTVKIFLASSAEMKDDRVAFEQFIGNKNKILNKNDQFLELIVWEDFLDAMSKTRLQDEYNKAIRECDIFVMLFSTKVGPYTREEFDTAFGQFQEASKPWIYTYFKTASISLQKIPRADIQSLWDFQDRLKMLGHFQTEYENSSELTVHFNHQLEIRNPFSGGGQPLPPRPPEDVLEKYWHQLIQDPDFNSMAVIGKRERQRLENLYVRLQVTAHGEKTGMPERFLARKGDKTGAEELLPHDMPPDVAMNAFQRFVVLGAPGMGKTTMFRYIAYMVARLGLGMARPDEFSLEKKTSLVPLYLPLTELSEHDGNLLDCLKSYFHKRFPGCKALTPLLDSLLKNGQCLVLLDSMDEVAAAYMRQVKQCIKGFLNNSDWQDNIVLLSCREASWQKDDVSLAFPAVLQIVDLDAPAIGEYLLHWFGDEASETALILKSKICRTPRLKALATNPFLLSLIAWLSQSEELPERRVELYEKCTKALLSEKHKEGAHERYPTAFGKEDHVDLKIRVLTDVAFAMMNRNLREIKRRDLKEIIQNSLGWTDIADERPGNLIDEIHRGSALLRETNIEHIYMFQHNTFREYFAARKLENELTPLLHQWQQTEPGTKLADFLQTHAGPVQPLQWMNDRMWTEVNRLTVGLLRQPTPVLELLFATDPTLAARCYLDAHPQKVNHETIRRLWTERIDREERIKIVRGIRENLQDEREVLDFIAGIFLTGDTDTEVLYHCDALLQTIGSDEAIQLSRRMFDHWPANRQYPTHAQAFEKDKFWRDVEIAAGKFQMGGNEFDDEKPIHPVKIAPFRLGCYAVTVAQFARFNPAHRKERLDDEFGENDTQPVVRVSWFDAFIFCKWAGGRLPTEAEWEYACRAGTATPFNTGENLTTNQANYHGNFPYKNYPKGKYLEKTVPVGNYPPNAWGLFDMHGNVYEWCRDWFDDKYYAECKKQGIVENPAGPQSGSRRVLRGGAWDSLAGDCRSAYRRRFTPDVRDYYVGFRLVFVPQSVGSSFNFSDEPPEAQDELFARNERGARDERQANGERTTSFPNV